MSKIGLLIANPIQLYCKNNGTWKLFVVIVNSFALLVVYHIDNKNAISCLCDYNAYGICHL